MEIWAKEKFKKKNLVQILFLPYYMQITNKKQVIDIMSGTVCFNIVNM